MSRLKVRRKMCSRSLACIEADASKSPASLTFDMRGASPALMIRKFKIEIPKSIGIISRSRRRTYVRTTAYYSFTTQGRNQTCGRILHR